MAQERFYFWRNYYDALRYLDDADAGKFVKCLCAFAFEGIEPDFSEQPMMRFAWEMVADHVRESVEIGRRQSEYGSMGGRPKKRVPKRSPKRSPESAMHGNASSGCAPSLTAQALAAETQAPEPPGDPYAGVVVDKEKARLDAIAFMESMETGDG